MDIEQRKQAFLTDLIAVYRKHGLSLSHEDGHGAFEIEAYDESNVDWVGRACIAETVGHQADEWIAEQWHNKDVVQTDGIPWLVSRKGKVTETFWDERGALHCFVTCPGSDNKFWCPAKYLQVVQ